MARRTWGWMAAAVAAGGCAAFGITGAGARPSTASAATDPPTFAGSITACTATVGSVVAVDFAGSDVAPYGVSDLWGGPVALGCDRPAKPAKLTGMQLLTDTGFTTAGDTHDGPEFICRIGSPLFDGAVQHPTPEQDPCQVTPPATGYWSYWLADAGATSWTYSPLGAASDHPLPGEVEAWTFGATDVSGSTGQPSFTPAQVRAQETPVTTTSPTTPTTPTGPTTTTSSTETGSAPAGGTSTTTNAAGVVSSPSTHGTSADVSLTRAARYLVTTRSANGLTDGTSLARNGYYESAPSFADFGLTIDGALALTAAHLQSTALHRVIAFIADGRRDGSHRSINSWTGVATRDVDGGAIGKEALLAEVVGRDPRHFAGHDLIAALNRLVCVHRDRGACAGGPGSFANGGSTFDQALAVMAMIRGHDASHVRRPLAFLESEQHRSGAYPSLVPSTGDSDVDSTAMAAMALALTPDNPTAARDERRALAWIAQRQERDGGFPGAAGDSTNSTALAIQALSLPAAHDPRQLTRARRFLGAEQNADGGFAVAATGPRASDVRATTQVLGGLVGTSFGTLTLR